MQSLLFLDRFNLKRELARVQNSDHFSYNTEGGIVRIKLTASTQHIAVCLCVWCVCVCVCVYVCQRKSDAMKG